MGSQEKRHVNTQRWEKTLLLGLADAVTIAAAYFMALFLRFDFRISSIEPQ